MAAAFQSNAFQNDTFQVDQAVIVVDAFNPTGIGAVVDFRKSDKAQSEFEARKKANEEDRKRAVYEAFYGKQPEPIDLIEDEIFADPEFDYIAIEKQLADQKRMQSFNQLKQVQIMAKHNRDALELLLMVC